MGKQAIVRVRQWADVLVDVPDDWDRKFTPGVSRGYWPLTEEQQRAAVSLACFDMSGEWMTEARGWTKLGRISE